MPKVVGGFNDENRQARRVPPFYLADTGWGTVKVELVRAVDQFGNPRDVCRLGPADRQADAEFT
jgi:hypothetical protein